MNFKNETKKIILFIVEGTSDRDSLSLILSRLINEEAIEFQVFYGDITADRYSTQQNIITRIDNEVKKFIKRLNGIKRDDICKIVHLIDIDGAYIKNEECFIEDPSIERGFAYTDKTISGNSINNILNRNEKKSSIMNKISSLSVVGGTSYSAYYFSCNLDHVLHDERNLGGDLKSDCAFDFAERFDGKEDDFIKFLHESDFAAPGDHKATWTFIKEGYNSLDKYCNFHLFFNR
jgi:hypothetical protein